MIRSKQFIVFLVICLLLVLTILLFSLNLTSEHEELINKGTNDNLSLQVYEANYFKNILNEARKAYLEAINNGKEERILITDSDLVESLLLNSQIINNTHIMINGSIYRFIILHIYDSEHRTNIHHKRIIFNNLIVEQEPKNRSITYTGGIPYIYKIHINNQTCKATFTTIGYIESAYKILIYINHPCQKIYTVKITINKETNNTIITQKVWLILIKA